MSYRHFNMLVYGLVIGIAGAIAALNWTIDPYGLFHGDRGRTCVVHHNERLSKYLFGYRYIPENFDGLLIGSSISANWDTSQIHGFSVYNASMAGGNISEGKLIAEEVIQRNPPRILLMIIHPYLTETFGRKTGNMVQEEYWGALGSHQLLLTYGAVIKTRLGWARQRYNAYGQDDFDPPKRLPGIPADTSEELQDFHVEERAVAEYADLLEIARRVGVKIVGVIPPFELVTWQSRQGAFQSYFRRIRPLFRENELIIDFNAPEYLSLRSTPGNFTDGAHLSRRAATELVYFLETRLTRYSR